MEPVAGVSGAVPLHAGAACGYVHRVDTIFLLTLAASNGALALLWVTILRRGSREWLSAALVTGLSVVFQAWLCWGPPLGLVTWVAAVAVVAAWAAAVIAALGTRKSPAADPTAEAGSSNPWGLSERELEIGRHLGRGLIGKEIAYELGVRPVTVKNHLYNMYRKTGTRGRVELLNRLRERGCL